MTSTQYESQRCLYNSSDIYEYYARSLQIQEHFVPKSQQDIKEVKVIEKANGVSEEELAILIKRVDDFHKKFNAMESKYYHSIHYYS